MNPVQTVLIVDDVAANRLTLVELLDTEGYQLVEAADGPTALRLAAESPPDLVLLDVMMAGMDGYEVCRRFRANERLAEVPIIMLTALSDTTSRITGIEAGADDFITKPFNRIELRARVRTITRLNRYRRLNEAQLSLRSTESRYQELFNTIDQGFCLIEIVFDAGERPIDYRFVEANPSFERQSGLTNVIGKRVLDLIPGMDPSWVRRFGQVGVTGKPARFIDQVSQLDRWFDISAFRVAGAATPTVAVLFTDITERVIADRWLRASEERHRVMFDLGPVAVYTCDASGMIGDFNRRAVELWGRSPDLSEGLERFCGSSKLFSSDGTHVPHAQCPMAEVLSGERPGVTDAEIVIERPDGTRINALVNIVALRDDAGAITGAINAFHDITERKAAEVAARENAQWLGAIFDQAAVGVIQADLLTRRFRRANKRFCDMLGYSLEELIGLSHHHVTHQDDIDEDLVQFQRLRDGTVTEFVREKRYLHRDGTVVWASVAVSGLGPAGETPTDFIAIVQDVTQQRLLDEHFLQAQKMDALGQFSGGIAHDFNNMLTAIIGYTELARMGSPADNELIRDDFAAVLEATSRATGLVRQILTFSRQEPPERTVLALEPIVIESLRLLRAMMPSSVEFESSIATDTPPIFANSNQLHQVLMNLGTNAWHSMKKRGSGVLRYTLDRLTVSPEFAATHPRLHEGDYARVCVHDTGSGMTDDTMRRIFEPFFTTKPLGEGTGFGLAVVHSIMDTHDGVVTVQSKVGEGSVFCLYFPADTGRIVQDELLFPVTRRGHGECILVVDDEPSIARLGKKMLMALGYTAESASRGDEALALVTANPGYFDLVLTDQTMPGMSGRALAGQLRELNPDIPVILTTGYNFSLASESAESGICEVLLKPTDLHTLGTAVDAALARYGRRAGGLAGPRRPSGPLRLRASGEQQSFDPAD